jgi:large subunit ribosomal protein L30
MAKIKITLKKSVIGYNQTIRDCARTLGLRKTRDSVIQENTPDIMGKVRKIQHLLEVEDVS